MRHLAANISSPKVSTRPLSMERAEAKRIFAHVALNYKKEREHMRKSFGLLPQGYCERKTDNS